VLEAGVFLLVLGGVMLIYFAGNRDESMDEGGPSMGSGNEPAHPILDRLARQQSFVAAQRIRARFGGAVWVLIGSCLAGGLVLIGLAQSG
jgi:hypothetical protein